MLVVVVDVLHLIQKTKIRAFREKSFFYYKKRYNLYRIPFFIVEPDLEVILKDNLYTPDIIFAKEKIKSKIDDLSSKDK
jgi:hypothetical protein